MTEYEVYDLVTSLREHRHALAESGHTALAYGVHDGIQQFKLAGVLSALVLPALFIGVIASMLMSPLS